MSKHYKQLNMDFERLVRGNRHGQAMPIDEELENIRREVNMKQILKREKIK